MGAVHDGSVHRTRQGAGREIQDEGGLQQDRALRQGGAENIVEVPQVEKVQEALGVQLTDGYS